ncbi:MFS general substrate transporter [Linderina pennispora]|uniref:MFS general substrate transporter n=1 Tax=Linderina pennispora TaxID=61395 RepID=A0A1Y1WLA5_9FUNG|nr:MFS general substrate transporter [Linderina pennispora]ORX74145.1 MFS general substrate transporter [Linderina pennispora]
MAHPTKSDQFVTYTQNSLSLQTLESQPSKLANGQVSESMFNSTETLNDKYEPHDSEYADTKETRTQLLSGYRLAMAIISLDILVFLSAIDMTIVATTYIPIGDKFGSVDRAEWIITSYLITTTAIQPIYGKISDTIVMAIVVFLIGSILCAVSNSLNMLIASRAIKGLGGAGLMSMALIVIADIMNERQRGKYVGIFSGTWGLGSAIAPMIGGLIVEKSKWPVVFWINIPFCVISAALIVMLLRIPRPKGSMLEKLKKVDFIGSLLSLAGLTLVLLALTWGGRDYAWSSAAGGVVLCGRYRFAVEPIMPMHLFNRRNVILCSLAHIFFGFGVNGPITFIPMWALVVKHASYVTSGLYLLPFSIAMVISSVVGGVLVSRLGRFREIIWFGAAMLTLGNGLLILLGTDASLGKIIGLLVAGGLGFGSCIQTLTLAAQSAVTGKDLAGNDNSQPVLPLAGPDSVGGGHEQHYPEQAAHRDRRGGGAVPGTHARDSGGAQGPVDDQQLGRVLAADAWHPAQGAARQRLKKTIDA